MVQARDYTEEKKNYKYFCPTCPSVRITKSRRATNYCGVCARKYSKKKVNPIEFDFKTMEFKMKDKLPLPKKKYFRHCVCCNDISVVSNSAMAKNKYCRECSIKHRVYTEKAYKPRKKVTKAISQEAIDKAIELNRMHKKEAKVRKVIPKATLTSEEMIALWEKDNKPSTIALDVEMPFRNSTSSLCTTDY